MLISSVSLANNDSEKSMNVHIANKTFKLIAPLADANIESIEQSINTIEQKQKELSEKISRTSMKSLLDHYSDDYMALFKEQDNILYSILSGNYSDSSLQHFISFRNRFSSQIKKDFNAFAQSGVLDEKAIEPFILKFDINTSEYVKIFDVLRKNFLR